ncbi:MAG: ATP-binding protein [Candidatus Promineifilaceae bacterium]
MLGYNFNTMLDTPESEVKTSAAGLFEILVRELADVFDAHGVCAVVALEIAVYCHTQTLVAISDPLQKHHDVWICNADGNIKQARWYGDQVSFGRLSELGKATRLDKYEISAAELVKSDLWQIPRETIVGIPFPLPTSYKPITLPGAICLIDPLEDCPLTVDNLETLATQVTILLDRAVLRQRSEQQSVEFGIVSDISYSITSTLNLEEIFYKVANAVRRALAAESISIGLSDHVSNEIVFVDALMGPLFSGLPPIRLKLGQGIAGWVALNGEATIVNDVYKDTRFFAKVDKSSGFQTNSILCVPLKVEQRVIGVLEAINKQNGHFDKNDLRLLQAFSGPLAVAIENASLHSDVLAEKRRIETIFSSMSEGLLTTNTEGWVTAANDALLTLLRRKEGDGENWHINDLIQTRRIDFSTFYEQVKEADEAYPQLACDIYQGDDIYIPVLVSGTTIKNEHGDVDELIFVFSDLRQIREVERMRDDFFNNIIHELRTPLATILMYARLLREGKAADDQAKADRFLGVIERESDRLQKMVRQMLQLAKLEAREIQRSPEPVSLNPIFEQILPPLADRATEKGLAFSQRIQSDLPSILGNEDTLYLIFKNLVENAIKFTQSGTVYVNAKKVDHKIRVEVKDEGIGIPVQAMPNLFKRFYRAQTAVERGIAGTGLGLYMVKEGIEKHGGSIDVHSEEGIGTTFIVLLPIVQI